MMIPSGRAGIQTTLNIMAEFVRQGRKTPRIRSLALSLVRDLPPKDRRGEVRRLHAWVRDNIRYVHDIRNVETVSTAEHTLDEGQGDCDDQVVLLNSLLESIGFATASRAIAFSPGEFVHVHALVELEGRWVPLETTERVEVGWAPPRVADELMVAT